jgi:hypothetical protein
MAAKPKSARVVKAHMESLILITEKNRAFCVVMGRKIHRYTKTSSGFDYGHWFEIRPRLRKGLYIADGVSVKITREEDYDEWKDGFKSVIDLGIREGTFYIDPNEPLIKFNCKWDNQK